MELLKFCALCVIMAISHLECSLAETEHMDLVAGDSLEITCNSQLQVTRLIGGEVHLLRKLPENITVYRNIDNLAKDRFPVNSYGVKLDTSTPLGIFLYTFPKLKVSDSGLWQCITLTEPNEQRTYIRNITFSVKPAADVSRAELTLVKTPGGKEVKVTHEAGGEDPATSTVRLLSGTYTMSCAAENGYPDPKYSLFLNGQKTSMEQVATFNLTTADRNVGCYVKVPRDEFSRHTLMFDLKIEEVQPEINCQTTSARVDDRRAVMNCTVVAADVTCKRVVWKTGTTNQDFQHGGPKVQGYDLTCKSNGVNSVWSSLEVNYLQQKHFDDKYFIKIKDLKSGDYQEEQEVQLLRKPGALGGSVQMTSLGSLALVAVVTLLKIIL